MNHSYSANHQHIVFATHTRSRMITGEVELRLYPYIGGICRSLNARLLEINGDEDHVHMLSTLPTNLSIAEFVGKVKGNSSRWVHETLGLSAFKWQRGYGAFSVSRSQVQRVKRYVRTQKEHHREKTFQEELEELFVAHEIAFEPRFIKG